MAMDQKNNLLLPGLEMTGVLDTASLGLSLGGWRCLSRESWAGSRVIKLSDHIFMLHFTLKDLD